MREWKEPKEFCKPKRTTPTKKEKPYGIYFGSKSYTKWYASAKSRDSALEQLGKSNNYRFLGQPRPIDKLKLPIFYQKTRLHHIDVYVSGKTVICPISGYETRMLEDGKVILHPSDVYHARKAGLKKIFEMGIR